MAKKKKLKRWRCTGTVVGGKYIGIIEAGTKKEAEKKALEHDEAYVSLCHQCSRECENCEIESVYAEEMADEDEGD